MPCCEICKGMFFFFYCPLLPLFWLLEYVWVFAKQKWRRHKRKKRYRALRAAKQSQKDKTYLLLDKYSRGKVEREILDFSKDLKDQRQKKKMAGTILYYVLKSIYLSTNTGILLNSHNFITANTEIKGFDNIEELSKLEEVDDEGRPSQEESSSDTTDADEAGDLEELLDPGDPVYFNYATAENTPASLTVSWNQLQYSGCVFG